MALPGETVGGTETKCMDCQTVLKLSVLRSGAGYYLGYFCPKCGPYSRESGYYPNKEAAEKALESGLFGR